MQWSSRKTHGALSTTNISCQLQSCQVWFYIPCVGSFLYGCHGVQNSCHKFLPETTASNQQLLSQKGSRESQSVYYSICSFNIMAEPIPGAYACVAPVA